MKEILVVLACCAIPLLCYRGCQAVQVMRAIQIEDAAAAAGAKAPLTDGEKRDPKKFGQWLKRNVP